MIEDRVKKRSLDTLYYSMGLDVLAYLEDPNVFELIVNPDGKLWVDTFDRGRIDTGIELNESMLTQVIYQIASMTDQIVDNEHPTLEAELPDGSRVQAYIPRVVRSPSMIIRKHSLQIFTLQNYVEAEIMTETQMNLTIKAIKEKKNIIAAGGTKSGKTTLLNAILDEIAKTEDRIISIEDNRELKCAAKDWLALQTTDHCNQSDLLNATLRSTPDRIVMGEVRRGEALDLLDMWSTGHGGGCCTVHSNSAYDTLTRLQNMISRVSVTPQQQTIAAAVNMVIYLEMKGLKRRVKEIIEVQGYDEEHKKYITKQIA